MAKIVVLQKKSGSKDLAEAFAKAMIRQGIVPRGGASQFVRKLMES